MEESALSIATIDSGSDQTKVSLLLSVDRGCRVAAQAVVAARTDAGVSPVASALSQLEELSGYRLSGAFGMPTSADATLVSTSAAPKLRAVVIARDEKDLKALVIRLLGRGYVEVTRALAPFGSETPSRLGIEDMTQELHHLEADAVFVSASIPREAALMAEAIKLSGLVLSSNGRILMAGPAEAARALDEHLPEGWTCLHLSPSNWSEQAVSNGDLDTHLPKMRVQASSGDLGLPDGSRVDVLSVVEREPSPESQALPVLAGIMQGPLCVVDVGGATTSIKRVGPRHDGQSNELADGHAALGAGSGLREVLKYISAQDIRRWLPFDIADEDLRTYLANRRLRAPASSLDVRQLMIEQAVARCCGLSARRFDVDADFLVATGGLAAYPRLGQVALTLIDIAQPLAPCRLLIDRTSLLPTFSTVLRIQPDAALSVVKSDIFVNAGACLSMTGRAKPGEAIAEVGLQRRGDSGSEGGELEEIHTIRFGAITRIPLRPGEQAGIRVTTARRFSFGIEHARRAWSARSAELNRSDSDTIGGGLLGLIIDARGRPLSLPDDETNRQAKLMEWMSALDAYDATAFSTLDGSP